MTVSRRFCVCFSYFRRGARLSGLCVENKTSPSYIPFAFRALKASWKDLIVGNLSCSLLGAWWDLELE